MPTDYYGCKRVFPPSTIGRMAKKPKSDVDENTLFLLTEVQDAFAKHFGVEVKCHSTLCRYCKGVRVPVTDELVRLGVVFTTGRFRMTSLKLWNKFLSDLNLAYQRAMELENG